MRKLKKRVMMHWSQLFFKWVGYVVGGALVAQYSAFWFNYRLDHMREQVQIQEQITKKREEISSNFDRYAYILKHKVLTISSAVKAYKKFNKILCDEMISRYKPLNDANDLIDSVSGVTYFFKPDAALEISRFECN